MSRRFACLLLIVGLTPLAVWARLPGDDLADPTRGAALPRPAGPPPQATVVPVADQAATLTQSRWYASDSLGFPYREIGWYRTGDFEWTLKKDYLEGVERDVLTLFHNGLAVEKQERELFSNGAPKAVLTFRQGSRTSQVSIDAQGKPIQETLFEKDSEMYRLLYSYRGVDLISLVTSDAEGKMLWTDRFSRTPEGRLRRVVRTFADGTTTESAWIYGSNGLALEWTRSDQIEKQYNFNADGFLTVQKLFVSDKLENAKTWSYQGQTLVAFSDISPNRDDETRQIRGPNGRIDREEVLYKGDVVATTVFHYNDAQRLESKDRTSHKLVEHWDYVYGEDGKLAQETLLVNGRTDTISYLEKGELVREELWFEGEKVLEVGYENGEKASEKFYRDGKLLREHDPRSLP